MADGNFRFLGVGGNFHMRCSSAEERTFLWIFQIQVQDCTSVGIFLGSSSWYCIVTSLGTLLCTGGAVVAFLQFGCLS